MRRALIPVSSPRWPSAPRRPAPDRTASRASPPARPVPDVRSRVRARPGALSGGRTVSPGRGGDLEDPQALLLGHTCGPRGLAAEEPADRARAGGAVDQARGRGRCGRDPPRRPDDRAEDRDDPSGDVGGSRRRKRVPHHGRHGCHRGQRRWTDRPDLRRLRVARLAGSDPGGGTRVQPWVHRVRHVLVRRRRV